LNLPEQNLRFLPQPNHQQGAGETLQPFGSALRYEHRQRELKFFYYSPRNSLSIS
jgi:hypothetical protein